MDVSTLNLSSSMTANISTPLLGLMQYLQVGIFSTSVLLGFPAYSYVIWMISTGKGRGGSSEFFILNICLCEIGTCLNCLSRIFQFWFASFAPFSNFLLGFAITGRPMFQCLMCVERFLAVVHPVTFLKLKPLRYRIFRALLVWFFILGSCSLLYVFSSVMLNMIAHTWCYSVQFLLFLSINLFCCVSVLRVLRQSGPGERKEENLRKRRAFHIILVATVTMVFVYAPFIVTGFVFIFTEKEDSVLWIISSVCYVLVGFVPLVIYLWRNRKLNSTLK